MCLSMIPPRAGAPPGGAGSSALEKTGQSVDLDVVQQEQQEESTMRELRDEKTGVVLKVHDFADTWRPKTAKELQW